MKETLKKEASRSPLYKQRRTQLQQPRLGPQDPDHPSLSPHTHTHPCLFQPEPLTHDFQHMYVLPPGTRNQRQQPRHPTTPPQRQQHQPEGADRHQHAGLQPVAKACLAFRRSAGAEQQRVANNDTLAANVTSGVNSPLAARLVFRRVVAGAQRGSQPTNQGQEQQRGKPGISGQLVASWDS